ncbi:MAG: zinc ribbon domain-containing protein [Defluviitaleaceae bacterium]|nr:zinc ribbon domain-containing protein [Defluviitaleaceae bacterium]
MLRSLLQGVGMGTGMGVGQEIAGTLIQHVLNRGQGGNQTAGNSMSMDIRCNSCNEINTGDSRFCGSCGNTLITRCSLQSGARCACGFVNANGQKFCSECGTRL